MHDYEEERSYTLILEVEDAGGEPIEHILGEGSAMVTLNRVLESEGYDPNSGNSLTMGSPGREFYELNDVKVEGSVNVNAMTITQKISEQVENEIIDGDIEVEE